MAILRQRNGQQDDRVSDDDDNEYRDEVGS